MSSSIQLILGGARSGKSRYALHQNGEFPFAQRIFIATAMAADEEMKDRIQRHRKERGPLWVTIEEPYGLADTLKKSATSENALVVIDCTTLWISNLLCGMGGPALSMTEAEIKLVAFIQNLATVKGIVRIVSNEVGLGIVPESALGRDFRDLQGNFNQQLASAAHEVVWMTAGLPQKIK
jgi:adenosylcobinamide kinase/adenosylcobinamide-phosphate guanylyltransferase